jgi:hypothetical protein
MHMVYKVLVSCLPPPHLCKLLTLVRSCFVDAYNLTFDDLRLFDYAIVAQNKGQFVGVLFVSKRTNHNNDVPLDSIGSGDACHDSVHLDSIGSGDVCHDSVHLEPPETVHDIQYLCVCKEFRKHNIASELLECCKAELAANEEVGINSKLSARLYKQSFKSDIVRQQLKVFFELNDFKVGSENEEVICMYT